MDQIASKKIVIVTFEDWLPFSKVIILNILILHIIKLNLSPPSKKADVTDDCTAGATKPFKKTLSQLNGDIEM